MVEGGVGDRLRVAHELDLLGVLDHAQVADVVMQARGQAGDGGGVALVEEGVEEGEVAGVLDGDDVASGLRGTSGGPSGGGRHVLVNPPGGVGAEALTESVEVARVGVEPLTLGGDEGSVGDLVVKGALGSGEPAKVGVVAQDHGVVASVGHELAETGDAPGACSGICHCLLPFFLLPRQPF